MSIHNIFQYVAVVIDTDGSAFITKAEFDSLKNNFQAQIDNYNSSIDSKIDGAIASYLAGIKLSTTEDLALVTSQIKNLKFCSYLPIQVNGMNFFTNNKDLTIKKVGVWGNQGTSASYYNESAYEYNWFGVNYKVSKIAMDNANGGGTNYLRGMSSRVRGISSYYKSGSDYVNAGNFDSTAYDQWGLGGGIYSCYFDPPGSSGGWPNTYFTIYIKLSLAQYVGNGVYSSSLPLGIPVGLTFTDEDKGYTTIVNFDNSNSNSLGLVGVNWNWHWSLSQPDYLSQLCIVKNPGDPYTSSNMIYFRSFIDNSSTPEDVTFVDSSSMHSSYVMGFKYNNYGYVMLPSSALWLGPSAACYFNCTPGNNVVESHLGRSSDWATYSIFPKILTTYDRPLVDLSDYQLTFDSRDYYINTYGYTKDPTNGIDASEVISGSVDLGPIEGMRPAFTNVSGSQNEYYFFKKNNGRDTSRNATGFNVSKAPKDFVECWKIPNPVAYGSVKNLCNGTLFKNAGLAIKQGDAVPFFKSKPGAKSEIEFRCAGSTAAALSGARIYITTNTVLQQSNAATGTVGGVSKEIWELPLNADGSFKVTFDSDTVEKTYYISLSPKESYTDKFRGEAPRYIKITDVNIKSIKEN